MKKTKFGFQNFRMVRSVYYFAVVLILFGPITLAEPNSAVRFLMKEPVSMLDWGFRNIEDHLMRSREVITGNGEKLFSRDLSVSADYEWPDDAIRISVGLRLSDHIQKSPETLSEVSEQVVYVLKYLKGVLTLKPYEAFFRHKGFRNLESPVNLETELSEVTWVIVTVRDRKSNILSMCRAPLLGEGMEWLKIGEH